MMLSLCALLLAVASTTPEHVVSGIVIDAKSHAAVRGASVSLPNGKRIGVTGRDGHFRIEIPAAPWPPSLTIAAPGLAERAVDLPHVAGDTNLNEVALPASARIHAIISPAFAAENLRWSLYQTIGGRVSTRLREGQFGRGRTDVILDSLASDNYLLLISGAGPLQQIAIKASPKPGEAIELPINITADIVTLSVVSGKAPMAGITIRMSPHDFSWSGIVACDEKGKATLELWQEDDFWASVVVDHGNSGFTLMAPLRSDTGTISWTFELPSHHVKGRVVDSSTHEPLPDVNVMISGTAPVKGGLEGLSSRTDADGRFDLPAIQEGRHTLRAYRKGYRYDEQIVTIEKDGDDWDGEIALDPTGNRPAAVVADDAGHPLAGVDITQETGFLSARVRYSRAP